MSAIDKFIDSLDVGALFVIGHGTQRDHFNSHWSEHVAVYFFCTFVRKWSFGFIRVNLELQYFFPKITWKWFNFFHSRALNYPSTYSWMLLFNFLFKIFEPIRQCAIRQCSVDSAENARNNLRFRNFPMLWNVEKPEKMSMRRKKEEEIKCMKECHHQTHLNHIIIINNVCKCK